MWAEGAGPIGSPGVNATVSLQNATSGQALQLANGSTTRDNEWNGALSDLGIWNVALTGPLGTSPSNGFNGNGGPGTGALWGTSGGETAALYNTPMSGITALQQYGVAAMDKLFTLYDTQSASVTPVTTGNGTLAWKYVASGLTGTSGSAGQSAGGAYYVQLDSAGGGVETVLPGDANEDGKVDINDLTIVLAHYGQTGLTWAQGELTGSGTVDINDLTIVLANYNQSDSAAAGGLAAVPEPSALLLLSGGLAGLLACACRRRKWSK